MDRWRVKVSQAVEARLRFHGHVLRFHGLHLAACAMEFCGFVLFWDGK